MFAIAADDPIITTVVSQVPLIDGWHRGRRLRQRLNRDVTVRLYSLPPPFETSLENGGISSLTWYRSALNQASLRCSPNWRPQPRLTRSVVKQPGSKML